VLAHAADLAPERFRTGVAADAERLRLNRRLVTLDLALPTVAAEPPAPQPAELFRLLEEMEMRGTLAEARRRYTQPELF